MRMNCFGDKVSSLHCKIVLLDEQQLVHEVLATTNGQDVLNVVYQHLGPNLLETAYFGLRYVDASHQPQWLDPNKRVLQQLKGAASQSLYFAVKFYAVDPCKLVEELTRYQFFLQIKKDILQGRLPVTTELAAELAALAIQSELGDYDPHRHQPGYVSEFRFLAHQSPDLETKIAELHKTMRGMVPAVAEMRYLERVKWLDLYGSDLHPVLGEDTVEYFLGLTPSGIVVLRNKTKVGNYFWPRISKIHFKGRYFMLRVRDKSNDESTYGFETPSKGACKSLYKCCSQHLAFFRLVQMSGPLTNASTTMTSGSNNNKYLRLSGAVAVTAPPVGGQSRSSPPQFRRMPSRRHQRRIVDGASHPPQVDECSTSDSDKTLDAASTATLLSPYHMKGNETTQRVPRSSDTWTEASSVRSRRSRSHSRSRKECRSNSVDSTESRSHHRRKGHRSRSRHNSDNESEVSRASETSNRTGSRRRRHRSSRDSSGSESENQSSQHRSHRRNKRRGSQGSTYELVDSEAQWREIQERQGQKQQMQTATAILPAAFSSPAQMKQQGVPQQATVRKASASLTSPSSNSSLLDQSNGELMMSTETASQASSRHRQHRKHHHRHSHKHRSHSRSGENGEKNAKSTLPTEIMPHLQYQLVEPPADSTADQLREIPYQQVVTGPPANVTKSLTVTKETAKDSANIPAFTDSLSRKRHRGLHPPIYPEERKIISVDNDSPPPPYSPPQNADSLAQQLAALSIPPPSRPRTRGSESASHNNPSGSQQQHSTSMSQASVNPPSVTARPVVPVPGPKPMGLKSNIPPSVAPRPVHHSNTNINGSIVNGTHGGNHQMPNGRQYLTPGPAVHNSSNKGFYNGNVEQYQHQDNRRVMNMPPSQQTNGNISLALNGFHYQYQTQQQIIPNNNSLAPNPHHVGLPLSGFVPNHSTPSTQVQRVGSNKQQNSAAPSTLPGVNGNNKTTNGLIHQHASVPEKSKSMMPLSPLANGVTVTNQMQSQSHAQDTLSRSTKYVTRPQTPVTQKTLVMSTARSDIIPYPSTHHQPNMNHQTMTLPHRSQQRTRTGYTDDKFAIQPPPTFAYNDNVTTRHASLPRLIRHIPAPQTGNSTIRYESTLPLTETETTKPRRASSLEVILSPMIESTLQRKKRAL